MLAKLIEKHPHMSFIDLQVLVHIQIYSLRLIFPVQNNKIGPGVIEMGKAIETSTVLTNVYLTVRFCIYLLGTSNRSAE